ncbi:MAG: zinc-binding dehydrogenase [Fusicatenibacter sp.]
MGAGCIGLVSMMALKARGVSEVYVVDIMEKRLEKELELGATGVINGAKEDVLERVKELTFKTVFRYRHIYPTAIDAVAAGKVVMAPA